MNQVPNERLRWGFMNILKATVLSFLSLLLVLCLSIFSLMLSANSTALNADYVNGRLESLPVTALLEEAEFSTNGEDNTEMAALIKSVITENEIEFKQRASEAVDTLYDYLKGKNDNLDLTLTLKETILDPEFAVSAVNKVNLNPLAKELVAKMMADVSLPYGLSLDSYVDEVARDFEPWIKEQSAVNIPLIFDYILGINQDTDIIISLEQPVAIIKSNLKQEFMQSPPEGFEGLPATELENGFNTVFDSFAGDILTEINLSTEFLAPGAQADITQSLADAEEAFASSRTYVGYFNLFFWLIAVFILLLIIGIIFTYREFKGAGRTLGVVFLIYGVFNTIAVSIIRGATNNQWTQTGDTPIALQQWASESVNAALTPMLVMSIVLLVIGVALLVLSYFYKPATATDTYNPA